MTSVVGPRIRGKVGQIEDPPELRGMWAFTIWLTTKIGGGDGKEIGTEGPFETKKDALDVLTRRCKELCEIAEQVVTGKTSGSYIDMKDNKTKNWRDHIKSI